MRADNTRATVGHYEGLVDRAYLLSDMWSRYVQNTLAVKQNPDLLRASDRIESALQEFYQLTGVAWDDAARKEEETGSFPVLPSVIKDMTLEEVDLVASQSRRWMPGTRHGSNRPAWKHPEDVVGVVRTIQALGYSEDWEESWGFMTAVAYGHDLLEDGVLADGTRVTASMLIQEGVRAEVVNGIQLLTKTPEMAKNDYAKQVMGSPDTIRVVKCADRIANLTEARTTFKPARWGRYVEETKDWIIPMALDIEGPVGAWCAEKLQALVDGGQGHVREFL